MNYFFTQAYSITTTSSTTGYLQLIYSPVLQFDSDAFMQIIQVDEYSGGGNIEGTIKVDDFDETKGHGGIICILVDGTQYFGANGKIYVSGCANYSGIGGNGGSGGSHTGTGGLAPTIINTEGNDATMVSNTYVTSAVNGTKFNNLDCGSGSVESKDGGLGTGKVKGNKGSKSNHFFKMKLDSYGDSCLTVGTSGKGGNGGLWGASAGGNGGSGASNWYVPHVASSTNEDNSGVKNGKGGAGTDPVVLTGFSDADADAGDGGNGGAGGGIIFMRAVNFQCQPNTVHFISNGLDGKDGEDGHGQGGDGGHNGKGSDGWCSTDGSKTDIVPPGGNGAIGRGGDGADGGSGGDAGEPGAIWLVYASGETVVLSAANCEQNAGNYGSKGLGTAEGSNGTKYIAPILSLRDCDCSKNGGTKVSKTTEKTYPCRCKDNFDRLSEMEPNGTTPEGYLKWTKPGTDEYCYWDDVAGNLVCYYEEETGGGTDKITSKCGDFDCSWVDDIIQSIYDDEPEFTFEDGELSWNISSLDDMSFSFRDGKFLDGFNKYECEKSCDPNEPSNESGNYKPKRGGDGGDGKPAAVRTPTIASIPNSLPANLEEMDNDLFQIFPNPANDLLWIKGSTNGLLYYEISNTLGQVVLSGIVLHNTLDISELNKGNYFIMIKGENGKSILSFRKE